MPVEQPSKFDLIVNLKTAKALRLELSPSPLAAPTVPLFVNGVGGPGTYERRSDADKKMNLDNVASSQADATTKRPRPVFTCEMAKAITAPTLLSNGERSPKFFYLIMDQLESCLPNRERIVIAGSSHTVPSENPDAYNQAVLAFLGKH